MSLSVRCAIGAGTTRSGLGRRKIEASKCHYSAIHPLIDGFCLLKSPYSEKHPLASITINIPVSFRAVGNAFALKSGVVAEMVAVEALIAPCADIDALPIKAATIASSALSLAEIC